ncbi:MAG TPA: hypothetical protein VK966_02625 [Longimicrobiales bacterium]|nr:hypothetical protein [Longimicrobiales bacterium]
MISYSVYRLVHLVGIILLFVVLGGLSWAAARAESAALAGNATRAGTAGTGPAGTGRPRIAMILHGVALFIVLLGGFGLLARLGIVQGHAFPGWVWAKLGIWLLAGLSVVIPRRKPEWALGVFVLLPVLGGLAAWLAIFKPF